MSNEPLKNSSNRPGFNGVGKIVIESYYSGSLTNPAGKTEV